MGEYTILWTLRNSPFSKEKNMKQKIIIPDVVEAVAIII